MYLSRFVVAVFVFLFDYMEKGGLILARSRRVSLCVVLCFQFVRPRKKSWCRFRVFVYVFF